MEPPRSNRVGRCAHGLRGGVTVTAQEMAKYLGKVGTLTVAGSRLAFRVKVTDVRVRFGQIDYQVTPLAGVGEAWHDSQNVTLDEVTA